jgi:hypothetical protein
VVFTFAILSATVPSRFDCAFMPDALVLINAEMLMAYSCASTCMRY